MNWIADKYSKLSMEYKIRELDRELTELKEEFEGSKLYVFIEALLMVYVISYKGNWPVEWEELAEKLTWKHPDTRTDTKEKEE